MTKTDKEKRKKIDTITREEDDGHIFWEAWLKPGWCWEDKGLHVTHEDTKKDILNSAWKIAPCDCPECSNGKE